MYEQNKDYSYELEAAVVGACLLEKTAIARVYSLIKPEHFYSKESKNAALAVWQMFESGIPVDILSTVDFLINQVGLFNLDGSTQKNETVISDIPYLVTKMTNAVTGTAHLEYHAYRVKQMFLQREIKRITSSGISGNANPQDELKRLYSELNSLNEGIQDDSWLDMSELMVRLLQHQDQMLVSGGKGLQTGFALLDELNGGFFPGDTVVIGARPSAGKSALAGQIALNVARMEKKVGFISLEMSNTQISARLASIDSSISFNTIHRALWDDEMQRDRFYNRVNNTTSKLPIFVSDETSVKATDIRAKASVLKARHGLDLLIIDYLQLISGNGNKNRTRENEVSEISKACKIMAKELECPVIELCQLNREVTFRKGKDRYPVLADLRESGSIEHDADVVMFLHRDYPSGFLTNEDGSSTENDADLLIRKWRNGRLGHIRMNFNGSRMMFEEKRSDNFRMYIPEDNSYNADNPF